MLGTQKSHPTLCLLIAGSQPSCNAYIPHVFLAISSITKAQKLWLDGRGGDFYTHE